jgi:molybdenum cofactor guanylyltransferase
MNQMSPGSLVSKRSHQHSAGNMKLMTSLGQLEACSGAVLAGGRSSRFGSNKALHVWQDKTLLEHALSGLEGCAERFVVGNFRRGDPRGRPAVSDEITIHPDLEPFQGALFGLARALEVAQQPRVCITACDMPNLSSAYWASLAELEGEVIIPENNAGLLEPLGAIYARSCLEPIRSAIAQERLKLTGWLEHVRVRVKPWRELESRFGAGLFLNVNRVTDLPLEL